jgi:hypothetical protein
MPGGSLETRALIGPATTFRAAADEQTAGAWRLLRRPLLLAMFFGCTVSLQASGRLSARLVADGIVSFAFIPIFEILSLAVVYRRGQRRVLFAQAVDLFFVANTPWLLWLLAFAAVRSLQTPLQATALPDWWVRTLLLSVVPTASWSAYIDLQFFRTVLPRQEGSAARDLILQRTISWTCILGWYLGHELWEYVAVWINV